MIRRIKEIFEKFDTPTPFKSWPWLLIRHATTVCMLNLNLANRAMHGHWSMVIAIKKKKKKKPF